MQNESGNGPVYWRTDFAYIRHLSICLLGNCRQFHGDLRRDDDGKLFLFPFQNRAEGRLRDNGIYDFLICFLSFSGNQFRNECVIQDDGKEALGHVAAAEPGAGCHNNCHFGD